MNSKFKTNSGIVLLALVVLMLSAACSGPSGSVGKALESGFITPPDEAKPRVWWHWMNGNITQEGIRADLEWMKRVGIGGFQNFDAALATPQIVEKRLIYMTPEWKDAFRLATALADSLGLEMAIAGSPGWSESGGPWVKPEEAMKKYVWSETIIEAGKPFSGVLPKPPSVTGTFQNVPVQGDVAAALVGRDEAPKLPEYYADVAVVAFRLADGEKTITDMQPRVTSSGGKFTLTMLTDGDVATATELPYTKPGTPAWIQYEFTEPQTFQSLSIAAGEPASIFTSFMGGSANKKDFEASDDGKTFSTIATIPSGAVKQITLTFAPITAKYFRFSIITPPPMPDLSSIGAMFGFGGMQMPKVTGTPVAEMMIGNTPKVNRFEDKAAFSTEPGLAALKTLPVTDAVKQTAVIDLTSKMSSDGKLDWTAPEGRWLVMRLGYSLTGHKNGPASPEATGLEVDKLNADHVKAYFTNYLDQYKDATGGLMGAKGLKYVITDSYEAGIQNWTDNMMAEFRTRRGYDMQQWLPVLAGYVVESAEASDKFLWDFRRTLSDLIAENHYDQLTTLLKERGMGRYTESHESGRAFIGDGMEVKRNADIPMSATWMPGGFGMFGETDVAIRYRADVRESSSVAHLYGKKFVAAESLTAIGNAWGYAPENLKPTADMELANGLNRFVIHCSPHQPVNDKIPGLGLGPFGQWFTRHETWAEQAGAWTTYLARSSYMLQQGNYVADIIYFYGEDNNITALFGEKLPDIPKGYSYDFVNADALVNLLAVTKGSITTPSGMSYRIMALDANCSQMTLPVLKKINEMVNAGAVIVGNKPAETPSLSDDPGEFKTIIDQLWANEKGENIIGQGKVYGGMTIKEALDALGIAPDFEYSAQDNVDLMFVHRQADKVDFYWVNNRSAGVKDVDATFRVAGRQAEIWHPETGKIEQASFSIENGVTKVPLHLQPNDAVFVVFRNKAKESSRTVPAVTEQQLATVEGPWIVKFQEKRGAPAESTFETLSPWNENADAGVKYFSGTGTYIKTIEAPAEWFKEGAELWLDLGSVKNLAEVVINGQSLGVVWKTPFRVNVTDALKQGENKVEIKVTNLWVNRLIGDVQPGVTEKITYTTMPFYQANAPLKPSGLLGPVTFISRSI
jgi:hypothetical protein